MNNMVESPLFEPMEEEMEPAMDPRDGPTPPSSPPPSPQPPVNLHQMMIDNTRMCVCDNHPMPNSCKNCDKLNNLPCHEHEIRTCATTGCARKFHRRCVQRFLESNNETYKCEPCSAAVPDHDPPYTRQWTRQLSRFEKARRFGIYAPIGADPPTRDEELAHRRAANTATSLENKLAEHIGGISIDNEPILDTIKNNSPRSYPTAVHMTDEALEKTTICGRRVETSLLMFQVEQCACCGRVQPGLDDPQYPKTGYETVDPGPVFKRGHLTNQYKPAYHCTCDDYCKGSQFWPAGNRGPNFANHYKQTHSGADIKETLGEPASLLCSKCYDEYKGTEQDPLSNMKWARKFSTRNGFGPIQLPEPSETINGDANFAKAARLQELMGGMTVAEEAAIRANCPLMHIQKLKGGNIASRGNTSVVYVQSKLTTLLPNLPHECKIVILTRKNKTPGSAMASTKFKRAVIQEVLTLLHETNHPAWKDTSIDQNRLDQWPEEGNLSDMEQLHIELPEEDNDKDQGQNDNDDEEGETPPPPANVDGGDEGPAPLQHQDGADVEQFEGVTSFRENGNARSAEAPLLMAVIHEQVRQIRNGQRTEQGDQQGWRQQAPFFPYLPVIEPSLACGADLVTRFCCFGVCV